MTDRYAMLKFKAYLASDRKSQSRDSGGKKTGIGNTSIRADTNPQVFAENPERTSPVHVGPGHEQGTLPIDKRPLQSVDTTLVHHAVGGNPAPPERTSRTASVSQADDRLHEPPLPKFEYGETHTTCEWCLQKIDRSLIAEKGWTDEGK
jgi:hypothetical protein